jgi:hypothetical protein
MLKSSVFSKVFSKLIFVIDDGNFVKTVGASGFGLQEITAIIRKAAARS